MGILVAPKYASLIRQFFKVGLSVVLFIFIQPCQLFSQSKLRKAFSGGFVEWSVNNGSQEYRQPMDDIKDAPIEFLNTKDDPIGLLENEYQKENPLNVYYKWQCFDYCGNQINRNQLEIKGRLMLPITANDRLLLGISFNYGKNYFYTPGVSLSTSIPWSDGFTNYFIEKGVYDSIRISSSGITDTTFVLPRTKLVYFEQPTKFIGIGTHIQFRINAQSDKKRHFWFFEMGFGIGKSINNEAIAHWQYFDYTRNADVRFFSDYEVTNYQGLTWLNAPYRGQQSFNFTVPTITNLNFEFGLSYSLQLLKNSPLRLGIGLLESHHSFFQDGDFLVSTKANSLMMKLQYGFK